MGIILSGALTWFSNKYINNGSTEKGMTLKRFPFLVAYLLILIWEIIKANIQVIKLTLAKELDFEPCVIYFKTDLKEQFTKVLLANSITLTPGTITVSLEDDLFCVHCLDKSMGEDMENSIFVKKLRKIEEV